MGGSFKVRCLDNSVDPSMYTMGKIYEFKDGKMIDDTGEKTPYYPIKNFEAWRRLSCAHWELIQDNLIVKEVKRKAKVGELVKVFTTDYITIHTGYISQVLSEDALGIELKNEYGAALYFTDTEYVVLENYTPPKHTMMEALYGNPEPKTLSDYTIKELIGEISRRIK